MILESSARKVLLPGSHMIKEVIGERAIGLRAKNLGLAHEVSVPAL